MRWIFLTLVLANVALFIWFSFESSHQDRLKSLSAQFEPSETMPGNKLVLVSELTEEQRQALDQIKPPPVSNPKPEPEETPEPEEESSLADTESVSSVPEKESANQPVTPVQCFILGPGANVAQVGNISQRLVAVGIISDAIELESPGDPEYWVVIPPLADDKAALRKLVELQGRNINAQVIFKGPLANAVSFGLFGQKKEAEKQAEKIRQLGYRIEIRSLPGLRKETWIFINERQSPKLTDPLWQGIQKDFPRLMKKPHHCR